MWIARDADGSLWIFEEKPYKDKHVWYNDSTNYRINERLFPKVKWEDEEPRELVLKPINEEQP